MLKFDWNNFFLKKRLTKVHVKRIFKDMLNAFFRSFNASNPFSKIKMENDLSATQNWISVRIDALASLRGCFSYTKSFSIFQTFQCSRKFDMQFCENFEMLSICTIHHFRTNVYQFKLRLQCETIFMTRLIYAKCAANKVKIKMCSNIINNSTLWS